MQDENKNQNNYAPVEPLSLQIDAALSRALGTGADEFEVVGGNSPLSISLIVGRATSPLHEKPQLIIVPDQKLAEEIKQQILFFDPGINCSVLPEFDVDPYSNLYPKQQLISNRVAWCYRAQNAKPEDVFIAPVTALIQRTIPVEVLNNNAELFAPGVELSNNISEYLISLGYSPAPLVEDVGGFSIRGGIVDIFSPAHEHPIRIELFGDEIESLRFFDPETQRSLKNADEFILIPAREVLFSDEGKQSALIEFNRSISGRDVDPEDTKNIIRAIQNDTYFHGIDFLISYFYKEESYPLDHFQASLNTLYLDPLEVARSYDDQISKLKDDFESESFAAIHPDYKKTYCKYENLSLPANSKKILFTKIYIEDSARQDVQVLNWSQSSLAEVRSQLKSVQQNAESFSRLLGEKLSSWSGQGFQIFVACQTKGASERIASILKNCGFNVEHAEENQFTWDSWRHQLQESKNLIYIVHRNLSSSVKLNDEKLIFLRDEDFFGRKRGRRTQKQTGTLQQRTGAFSFGDLKSGDLIVHKLHGIGKYIDLKVMSISGVDSEFIEIEYKGKDKLYLPVYRVGQMQKFSGPQSEALLDKLGGTGWAKTKTKVRSHLHDVAAELLKLYAFRTKMEKPPFSPPDEEYFSFCDAFPYEETDDQQKAIDDVLNDMTSEKPMDRLVCGDVGFGKTEVALRAAFKAIEDGKQVALIAPTTILTFQHEQTFKKRLENWPVKVAALNRLVSKKQQKEVVEKLKSGEVNLVVGTHRLFSKDIEFKKLGLLIIDEEQKFGVKHKEKIRKLKQSVDTIAMSATPIPRTLNMSLMGLRDLSIINTPPVDRLPTRTFVTKFDPETIRKAVQSEISRGGQVFFLHNRVHSIYALEEELKQILPDVRMAVAHGQMQEKELETTMLKFFRHELDMLICTTIIESGMDIPKANTMFIDNAHQLGLSQLYQLRGRVGRSKTRAYCYLLIPKNRKLDDVAQERLRVIQEHTALGSGIQIAQYDLELRGAGDLLGEEQSGHINAVGYELYLELLEQEVAKLKGVELEEQIEPEINLRIPAFIPDNYIPDIRLRLAYYKTLSEIAEASDIDTIEEELHDQFGTPPEPVINLLGVMLIRKISKDLKVKDITAGKVGLSLILDDKTPLSIEKILKLTQRSDKKYSIAPDNRLKIRMKEVSWPRVYEELEFLKTNC